MRALLAVSRNSVSSQPSIDVANKYRRNSDVTWTTQEPEQGGDHRELPTEWQGPPSSECRNENVRERDAMNPSRWDLGIGFDKKQEEANRFQSLRSKE
jgi:hypothetical protein